MATTALNLPFLRRFRPLAYTLVLLAIAAAAYAEPNPPLFFLGTLGTLVSWWLVERPRGNPLPRALINVGVLAASCGLFYELVLANRDELDRSHPNLLLALSHFMVFILLCKLFERKSNRDYAQILTLTLLIMVAGAIVATSSLLFAVLLAAYLALGLYAILLFHLRAETERALNASPAAADTPLGTDSSATIKKDIRLVAAWSAMLLLAVATGVFLLFPRSSAQDFFSSLAGSSLSTGFSERVRMLDYVHLRQSEALVMEVKLEQDGVNIGSESVQFYFRGLVLDTYDSGGRQWIRSLPKSADEDYPMPPDQELKLLPAGRYNALGIITQSYTLHLAAGNALFALAPPVSIASDQLRTVSFSPREMVLATQGAAPLPLHYTVLSPVIAKAETYGEEPTVLRPGDLGTYRIYDRSGDHVIASKMPEAVSKLAQSLVPDLLARNGEPLNPAMIRQIAERFQDYLQKTYPYSLNFKAVDRRLDPTEDFLLNRKETGGHCEFFASAMVMMCRAVGINARMATGYHGGEFNSIGGFYVVKQKFAHAWVEVFVPRRGWMVYDPSPAAAEPSPASSVARWFREMAEVMQKSWLSTVVAFDNTSRKYLFNSVSGFLERGTEYLKVAFQNLTVGFRDLFLASSSPWWLRLVGLGSIAVMVSLVFWLVRSWNRRQSSQIPRILRNVDKNVQRQLAHDLFFFDDLLRILARLGPKKSPEQTPLEYVENLSPRLRPALEDARWLIGIFYDIRFGTLRVNGGLRQQIAGALHRLRQVM